MKNSYANAPIVAQWLTAGKNDAPGTLTVPTRCHHEPMAECFYREHEAYHVYYQKTTKVIGGEPRVEWIFKVSLKQDAWDKALQSLAKYPAAKAEYFGIPSATSAVLGALPACPSRTAAVIGG